MATASSIIGTITLIFSFNIIEYAYVWLGLDIVGLLLGYLGYKKGERDGKTGLVLCGIATVFNLVFSIILFFYNRSL